MPRLTPEHCAKEINRHGKRATKAMSMADDALTEGRFDLSKQLLGEAIGELQYMQQNLSELERMKDMATTQRVIERELDHAEEGRKGFGSKLLGKAKKMLPALPKPKVEEAPEEVEDDPNTEEEYDEETGDINRVPKKGVR